MNSASIIANDSFTAQRPVSFLACATFLATSIYVAHQGLVSLLPTNLATALTALFVALAVLQWLAMGRKEACEEARDHDRADAVIHQAIMFGIIETVLYAAGGLALAADGGMPIYNATGIAIATVGAALFAYSNFKVKWVSCDRVRHAKPQPKWEILPAEQPAAAEELPSNVVPFDISQHLETKTHAREARERAGLAAAPPVRSTSERLVLATKRLQTRARRERLRAAA